MPRTKRKSWRTLRQEAKQRRRNAKLHTTPDHRNLHTETTQAQSSHLSYVVIRVYENNDTQNKQMGKDYRCICCNKRAKPKDRSPLTDTVKNYLRKVLPAVVPTDSDVICFHCRVKSYKNAPKPRQCSDNISNDPDYQPQPSTSRQPLSPFSKPIPDHRRKWDTEEYEKIVAARLVEEEKKALEKELSKLDPPVRREMPREYKTMNPPNFLSLQCVNKELLLSWQPPLNEKGGPQDVSSYIVFASPLFVSHRDTIIWQKLYEVQGTHNYVTVPKNYWNTTWAHVIGVVAVNGLHQSAMAKVILPFHGDDRLRKNEDTFQCHVPVKKNLRLEEVTGHCMVEEDYYNTLSYIFCAIPIDVTMMQSGTIPLCKMKISISPALSKMIETSTDSNGIRNVELHLRFCEYDLPLGHCKDRIPDCLVFVGSQRVHIQENYKESSVHRPVDITKACALAKYDTTLSVELSPQETKKHCLFITVVKRLEMRTILQRLLKNMPSILEAKQYIQGRFQTDSSEVQSTSYKAKLTCPIGQSRLVTPCRGDKCSHILCMEAETLVRMNEGKSVKKCFICQKPYSNIVVDKLFLLILKKVPPCVTEVEFQPDGSWSYSNNETTISSLTLDEEGIHSGIPEVDMSLNIENNNSCMEIQNCDEILPESIPDLNGTHTRVNTEEHKSITVGPTNPFDSRHRRDSTDAVFSQECSGETQEIYCVNPSDELPKEKEHIDTLNTPQCRSKPTKRITQFEKQKSSKLARCSSRVSGQKGAESKERDIQKSLNTTIPNKLNNGSNLEKNRLNCMSQGLMQSTVILGSISDKLQETVSKSEIGSIHSKDQIDILVNDSQKELNAMDSHVEEGKFVKNMDIVFCEWAGNKETYTEMEDDKSVLHSIIVDTQLECREHGATNKSVTNKPKQTHSQQSINVGKCSHTHLSLLDNLISNTFTCSICKEEFGLTKVYENLDERLCIDCARKEGVLSLSLYNIINTYEGK
ncbi:uncharacterized protein LOC127860141 isoform X3 [Dreissena polymorpha]|uniref:uncharacterized protein LOC127860141 isoform X3 n=1 Tax=Dreissena polymorpha TaxID=45954 RepID=UPI002264FE35|nr:uncharacterized protein LOC127860141 isoform X3 [Dreissena polymorpha]